MIKNLMANDLFILCICLYWPTVLEANVRTYWYCCCKNRKREAHGNVCLKNSAEEVGPVYLNLLSAFIN